MNLDPKLFRKLLKELDVVEAAKHSCFNHHVNGMNYLCLSRTKDFTVKVYLIENPYNANDGYLVNPHSHRYAFGSIVLRGELDHIRFEEYDFNTSDRLYSRYDYNCDRKELMLERDNVILKPKVDRHKEGSCYWVEPVEIHTLGMLQRGPLVLGLVQFKDVMDSSTLYLPHGKEMRKPATMQMNEKDAHYIRNHVLDLMEI